MKVRDVLLVAPLRGAEVRVALKVWANPGPFPHVARWEFHPGDGLHNSRFVLKCAICYRVFDERAWTWTAASEGPTLKQVESDLNRARVNCPDAAAMCDGAPK